MFSHESLRSRPASPPPERFFFDRVIARYGQWLKTVLNHPLTLGGPSAPR
ncbi:hypothetical protein M8494_02405 [Serratia ureilytica]